jgi:uncharacterized protein (DUF2141 family)
MIFRILHTRTLLCKGLSVAALLALPLLPTGCAHIEPPSGGPIDTKVPVVAAVYPAPCARNVPVDAPVVLQFSEWIDRTVARNQVFVSPPTRGKLRVVADGNKLQVQPSESANGWRPNTAYQVTVLPGLQDLHGVRAGRAFSLRFSTGADIGSASLSGAAISPAPTGTRMAALYRTGSSNRSGVEALSARDKDFTPGTVPEPWRELPAFLALADSTGAFHFDSVAAGEYALFAFEDVNGNFAFDLGFENAAVGPLSVTLGPVTPEQVLRTAPADTMPLRLVKAAFVADSLQDSTQVVGGDALLAGKIKIEFSRSPHPTRAAEAARYRVLLNAGDSGAALPVLSAAWSPLDEAWVLETAPLRAGREYRVEMQVRPDFQNSTGADTSAPFTVEAVGTDRDTAEWKISFVQVSALTSLPVTQSGVAAGADFSVASSRSLSPARWKVLAEKLEVRVDTATAPHTLSRINNFTFSLRLQKNRPAAKRLALRFRPTLGDSNPTNLGSVELLDSAALGAVQFTAPARWTEWTFRLDQGERASFKAPAAAIPVGRYRLLAFRDVDRDGVWNPGALKPWTPQEPHALVLDSVMVTPGPATDITRQLEQGSEGKRK